MDERKELMMKEVLSIDVVDKGNGGISRLNKNLSEKD